MQRHNYILKYLLDIEAIIDELEKIIAHCNSDYQSFSDQFISVRAVERDLMIIGEAVGKIIQFDSTLKITNAKHIVGLRNMIVHSYDSIDPTTLWKILMKDLPLLKTEVKDIKSRI